MAGALTQTTAWWVAAGCVRTGAAGRCGPACACSGRAVGLGAPTTVSAGVAWGGLVAVTGPPPLGGPPTVGSVGRKRVR